MACLSVFERLGEGSRACVVQEKGYHDLSIRTNGLYIRREDLSLLGATGINVAIYRIAAGGRRALLLGLFAVPGPSSTPQLNGALAVFPVLFGTIINSDHGDDLLLRLSVAF
jgi:hypothetical protein